MNFGEWFSNATGKVIVARIRSFRPTNLYNQGRLEDDIRRHVANNAVHILQSNHLVGFYVGHPAGPGAGAGVAPMELPLGLFAIMRVPMGVLAKISNAEDDVSKASFYVRKFRGEFDPEEGSSSPALIKWNEDGHQESHAEGIALPASVCEMMADHQMMFAARLEPYGFIDESGSYREMRREISDGELVVKIP